MEVAVTGGLGFIGRHTVELLSSGGHSVRVLDDLSRAAPGGAPEGARVVRVDVRDLDGVREALEGVDAVIHLAALTDVRESAERPLLYHEVNSTGTLNVLRASVEAGVSRVVYASSAAVYGEPETLPIREDHPTRPTSIYGATKLSGEAYCRAAHGTYGLSVVVLRYFNVYGPGQNVHYAGVIAKFAERISKGLPLVIYGDGRQTRDFIHVRDVARANLVALEAPVDFGVFNVATGREVSVLELSRVMQEAAGVEVGVEFGPPIPGDIRRSVGDPSKIEELGFRAETPLEEGIKDLISPGGPENW